MDPVTTYQEFQAYSSRFQRLRSRFHFLRKPVVFAQSLWRSVERDTGWIRFLLYHHVFDDERTGFDKQLRILKKQGTFLSYEDAISILESGHAFDGRYFCLSFDDGFRNCVQNALPILADHDVSGIFFIPVDYMGSCLTEFPNRFGYRAPVEFLTWSDCRQLRAAGMLIGSHTLSHSTLMDLNAGEVRREMEASKKQIESNVGTCCDHFAAPRGKPGLHFSVERDPLIARELNYRSFATTQRGAMQRGHSAYYVRRVQLEPGLDEFELRHALLSVE